MVGASAMGSVSATVRSQVSARCGRNTSKTPVSFSIVSVGDSGSATARTNAANASLGASEAETERVPQRSSGSRLPSLSAASAVSQMIRPSPVLTGSSGTVATHPPRIIMIHSSA